jgi:hypothetical protein
MEIMGTLGRDFERTILERQSLFLCNSGRLFSAAALASAAQTNLILFETYKDTPESTDHIVQVMSDKLGQPVQNLLRLDDLALPPSGTLALFGTSTLLIGFVRRKIRA